MSASFAGPMGGRSGAAVRPSANGGTWAIASAPAGPISPRPTPHEKIWTVVRTYALTVRRQYPDLTQRSCSTRSWFGPNAAATASP